MARNPNRIKVIKQSRARPRVLWASKYQKVRQSVDKTKIPKDHRGLFEYRSRGNTFVDDYLEAKFPSHNEESQERLAAKALSDRLLAAPDAKFKTVLQDGRFVKICMVTTAKLDCIEFIQFEVHTRMLRRSVTYGNYDRAMEVFRLQTIRWKESHVIPDVEDDSIR